MGTLALPEKEGIADVQNLPCDAKIPMTITISNREYNVDPTQLVQQRGASPTSCWSTIVAWQNGSLPDTNGEIRLGTPFLSGVYAYVLTVSSRYSADGQGILLF
jgi:hypothetical protein